MSIGRTKVIYKMNAGAEKFNIFILAQKYSILGLKYNNIYCIGNRLIYRDLFNSVWLNILRKNRLKNIFTPIYNNLNLYLIIELKQIQLKRIQITAIFLYFKFYYK